ncbi:MAG: hypothetical protein GWN94_24870 [Phycisphaerae bacterium]|nr:hypothetical protein [Phycisphaerae bacterium]NIP56329.1 hypothetical protein [Phycisphaerae bacterium]NIS54287.1 hypothetical protein [Phycisphaerae bacterium]NIX29852.1 hypothetical protein [Phycisphaerae bacterium]
MPLRSVEPIITRQALTRVSLAYRNVNFVADKLFPIIEGANKETKVLKYNKAPWFRDEAGVRSEGGVAPRADMTVTSVDFDPINYSISTAITDELREQSKIMGNLPVQPEIDAQIFMANKLDLKKEVRASSILHSTNWSSVGVGGEDAAGAWGHATAANDTFLADMRTGHDTIINNTGYKPNKLFLSYHAASKLRIAPALLAYIYPQGFTPSMFVSAAQLAVLADVEEVIIGSAIKNTDEETVADSSSTMVQVWGTSGSETKGVGFLFYAPSTPRTLEPSAGYQYRKTQSNGLGRKGTEWREPERHQDAYDMQEDTDIAATGTDLGYMWKDTATT